LVLFVVGLAVIIFASPYVGDDASIWLYILLALACGFAAPGAQRRALKRRGYWPAGHVFATDRDMARLSAMETRS
jgi:hypothetical protein